MSSQINSYGYYHAAIRSDSAKLLMRSNNERAFTVVQLQDLLSPRLTINEAPAHRQLASCIDLLAFSITRDAINLVLFSIDSAIVQYFINCISGRLAQYKTENQNPLHPDAQQRISIKKLAGPHEALAQSISLHLMHQDWEYDRYSSIGFYLHDRRGDWMRTWRLTNLFDNEPANYMSFIRDQLQKSPSSRGGLDEQANSGTVGAYACDIAA